MITTGFPHNLRRLRQEADLSLAELAAKVAEVRQTLWGWETGRTAPRPGQLLALATALGCTVDELVRPAGERPRLSQDPTEWARGYRDGFSDCPPPEGRSGLAYSSGRVEGEADRLAGAANRLTQ